MWSIYKASQKEVEGSEAWELSRQFPYAVSHDVTNTVFVTTLDTAIEPFILPQVTTDGEKLSEDEQAVIAAKWLFNQSNKAMWLTKSQALMLFSHPAHRLWCAKYEEEQAVQFESDYNYVKQFLDSVGSQVVWPEFSTDITPQQARSLMLQGLSQVAQ